MRAQPRARRLARRERRRRSRSRCGPRSPASTRATGSIPPGETRDVTVRLAPEARGERRRPRAAAPAGERRRLARRRRRRRRRRAVRAARPGGDDHARRRAGADRPPRPRQGGHRRAPTSQGRSLSEVTRDINAADRQAAAAAGLPHLRRAARRETRPRCSADLRRARRRGDADVPDPGGAVRLVPRSAGDPALAAAVADRRGAGAARSPATR